MATKKTRRAKATGGLYQRESDGCWVAAVELPSHGGKRRRRVVVRAKKADALAELRKMRDQLERAGDLATASPTLSAWLDVWWTRYAMKTLKVSVRGAYQTRIEQYIRPCLGSVKLDKLTPEHIHRLHDYVTATKGLSITTARGTHRVLSSVLADALREDKVTRNLCLVVPAPKPAVHHVTYLDGAQGRQLLAAHDPGDGTAPAVLASLAIALLTGMRQAERLGITREMVDLERGVITVAWQLRRLPFEHGCGPKVGGAFPCGRRKGGYCPKRLLDIPTDQEVRHVEGGLYLLRPKSKASWRRIPMVGPLAEVLALYLEANEPGIEGLIFTRPGGRPVDPSTDTKAWKAATAAAGLPFVNGHSARHSCNTILTELGVPVDVRTQILGHASKAINEDVYTHTSDARTEAAMRSLGASMDWR